MLGTTPLGRIWDQVIGDANHSARQSTLWRKALVVAKLIKDGSNEVSKDGRTSFARAWALRCKVIV